jgi:MarR family transcriptional regulator, organic hydroperoxide resistance regulator
MAIAEQVGGDVAPPSAADETWAMFRQLFAQQRRRFLQAAGEFDLHPAQAGALMQMTPGEPMPMHELAKILACDNSNVTGIIDRLEARGLVARQPYAGDRRVKHLTLTPLGISLHGQMLERMCRLPEGFDRLEATEQRELRDLMRRVLDV